MYKKFLALLTTAFLLSSLLGACSRRTPTLTNFQGQRIYQIMTDRFYDGDPGNNATGAAFTYSEDKLEDFLLMHGGDWQGIIDKLDYIKGMGYTAIWISPISDPQLWSCPDANGKQMPTAYHGYHTYDPYRANRYFGAEDPDASKAKLKELVDKCHQAGLRVIFDVVPNHVGDYIKGVGKDAHYSQSSSVLPGTQLQPGAPLNNLNWYHNLGPIDWSKERPHNESSDKMLFTHDLGELDDINYDVPEAKAAMFKSIKYWFDYCHADAARVDAVKCLRPEICGELEKYLAVPTFGENFDSSPKFIARWLGQDRETGMLDFPLFMAIVDCFAQGKNFSIMRDLFAKDHYYGDHINDMVTFIDNHDRNRFLTEAHNQVPRLQNALAFLFTVRGVPCVFQGTEQNRGNADGKIMSGGMPDIWNRWCMVTKDRDGKVIHDYFRTDTDTYKLVAALNKLRAGERALSCGKQTELLVENNVYAFSRQTDKPQEEIICAFNNSDKVQDVEVPLADKSKLTVGAELQNVFAPEEKVKVSDSGVRINLPPQGYKIYRLSR